MVDLLKKTFMSIGYKDHVLRHVGLFAWYNVNNDIIYIIGKVGLQLYQKLLNILKEWTSWKSQVAVISQITI